MYKDVNDFRYSEGVRMMMKIPIWFRKQFRNKNWEDSVT